MGGYEYLHSATLHVFSPSPFAARGISAMVSAGCRASVACCPALRAVRLLAAAKYLLAVIDICLYRFGMGRGCHYIGIYCPRIEARV